MFYSKMQVWLVILLAIVCKSFCAASVKDNTIDSEFQKYEPTWESLDKRPLPEWYDKYKIGIFVHWGVYTVPSFGSEWFWTNWEGSKVPKYVDFMKNNYKPRFTYQEFANDFTAELFDPDQWAQLFKDSGALYVVVTSKHHDGYALWPNSRSFSWNSRDIGPNRDIIKELADAIRKQSPLVFGLYYSLFEWFNRLYLEDKANGFKTQTYVRDKVLPDLQEIISLYEPEIIWSDGDWEAKPEYWNSTEFLAWLYNSSPVRDTVVTNDRWGSGVLCAHGDFFTCSDRYNPGVLVKHKWENAFTLDKTSWGQRFDTTLKDYMTPKELIAEIVITVSCGGNVLVNIGPTRHGTIQPIFEERLRTMGKWLKINGDAIYLSKPWIYQNDTQTPDVWYTQKNIGERTTVYAMVLKYPYETNEINLYALGGKLDEKSDVALLGYKSRIKSKYDGEKLRIIFPPKNLIDREGLELAWTFEINIPSK